MVKKCCIKGCNSESYAGCGVSFFKLPSDETKKKEWLDAIKVDLPNYAVVCSRHFRSEDIIKHVSTSKLKNSAVPSIFPEVTPPEKKIAVLSDIVIQSASPKPVLRTSDEEPFEKPINISAGPSCVLEINPLPSTSGEPPSKRIKLQCDKTEQMQREVKILKQRIRRRDIKIEKLQDLLSVIRKQSSNPDEVQSVIKNNFVNINEQFNYDISNKGVRYTDEFKSFALTLYYYSPRAFRFLRKHICLPHPATLRRLLATRDCNVGFIQEVFAFLKDAASRNDFLHSVGLLFDSMSIRSGYRYDKKTDKFWGYVDFGGILQSDSEMLASEVLVLMIVSYTKRFKCPIAYFYINKISAQVQAQLVITAIRMLAEVNIVVRSLTCDGTIVNVKTYELLGCNFELPNISTSFKHPTKECQVYCIFDPPHMIKLVRNVFAETTMTSEKGDIQFKYVRQLHEMQEEEGLKLANKLSEPHVNFSGKKMSVKLATQVLSSSVADAIEFLSKAGDERFVGSEATIEYIRMLDRIFDVFNSKNPFGRGFKSALRLVNKEIWTNILTETREYLMSLKVNGQNILQHRRKTPALGMIVNSFSFTNLATELLSSKEYPMNYFLTYKCSQDQLEMFFSCIRSCGSTNDNPDALQLRYTLRKLLFRNTVQPSINANCTTEEDFEITPILEFRHPKRFIVDKPTTNVGATETCDLNTDDTELRDLQFYVQDLSLSCYKNNILYYVAGHCAKKISEKLTCEYCLSALFIQQCKTDDHSYAMIDVCTFSAFTTFIDRGKLKHVSKFVFEIVRCSEKIFLAQSSECLKTTNKNKMVLLIMKNFYTELKKYFDPPHPLQSFECEDSHEMQLIKSIASYYLFVRLINYGKSQTQRVLGEKSTLRQRLHKTVLFNHV